MDGSGVRNTSSGGFSTKKLKTTTLLALAFPSPELGKQHFSPELRMSGTWPLSKLPDKIQEVQLNLNVGQTIWNILILKRVYYLFEIQILLSILVFVIC